MGRRIRLEIGEYYHLYNRGVDRRVIFHDKFDHLRFIVLLHICNSKRKVDVRALLTKKDGPSFLNLLKEDQGKRLVSIGAYCLMPNHFHILVREQNDGGISTFMKKLSTAYAMYFNRRYDRSGALFEGRFKAKHVDTDEYLKYLFAYIHLNPVKLIDPKWKENGTQNRKEARKFLKTYDFSSYLTYAGTNTLQKNILDTKAFPRYFTTSADFNKLIEHWLSYTNGE